MPNHWAIIEYGKKCFGSYFIYLKNLRGGELWAPEKRKNLEFFLRFLGASNSPPYIFQRF